MNAGLNINLDAIFMPYIEASYRLKYFSAIGTMGARKIEEIKDWGVHINSLKFEIASPNKNNIDGIKDFFPLWLNACLLRDALEGFYYAFDNIYHTCSLVSLSKNGFLSPADVKLSEEKTKEFIGLGAHKKRKLLKKEYDIKFTKDDYKKIYKGIKDVRDCLSHHNGVVRTNLGHAAKNNKRTISWLAFKFYIIAEGIKKELEMGKEYTGPADIQMEVVERHKEFGINDKIKFTREEIFEIDYSFEQLKADLMQQVIDFVSNRGIVIQPPQKGNPI